MGTGQNQSSRCPQLFVWKLPVQLQPAVENSPLYIMHHYINSIYTLFNGAVGSDYKAAYRRMIINK